MGRYKQLIIGAIVLITMLFVFILSHPTKKNKVKKVINEEIIENILTDDSLKLIYPLNFLKKMSKIVDSINKNFENEKILLRSEISDSLNIKLPDNLSSYLKYYNTISKPKIKLYNPNRQLNQRIEYLYISDQPLFVQGFIKYFRQKIGKAHDFNLKKINKKIETYKNERNENIINLSKNDSTFLPYLFQTIDTQIKHNICHEEIIELSRIFSTPAKHLEYLKNSNRIVSICWNIGRRCFSNEIHEISVIALKLKNWDIFIKGLEGNMYFNQNTKMLDSSRNTIVPELEACNVNSKMFLLGSLLNDYIEFTKDSNFHLYYYLEIKYRLALQDSKNAMEIRNELMQFVYLTKLPLQLKEVLSGILCQMILHKRDSKKFTYLENLFLKDYSIKKGENFYISGPVYNYTNH